MDEITFLSSYEFASSFYVFASALTVAVLLLNMVLNNKASALTLFAFGVLAYVFQAISGRTLYFADFFQVITEDQRSISWNVIFTFLSIAGTVLIWFLLRRSEENVSNKVSMYVWLYICVFYLILSISLFFAFPFGMPVGGN